MPLIADSKSGDPHPFCCVLLWGFITPEMSITETWKIGLDEARYLYHLQYQLYLYVNYENKLN